VKIAILHPGTLATVQDLGRTNWRAEGIPLCGAADTVGHRIANFLTGNTAGAATIELAGGKFSAWIEEGGRLALSGAGGQLRLDGFDIAQGRSVFAPSGTLLEVLPAPGGSFSYLATTGGWDVPVILDSRSTCLPAGFGGLKGRMLQKGDMLSAATGSSGNALTSQATEPSDENESGKWAVDTSSFRPFQTAGSTNTLIRVLPGPESERFEAAYRQAFFEMPFTVSLQKDRMGVRLRPAGTLLPYANGDMLSTAVMPGTIQVPPDGNPVALLADAQTTGGYPRIAQVIAVDIPVLAQAPPGQTILFQTVTFFDAEKLLFEQEKVLQKIHLAVQFKLRKHAGN
jgi:antagonist of KipI